MAAAIADRTPEEGVRVAGVRPRGPSGAPVHVGAGAPARHVTVSPEVQDLDRPGVLLHHTPGRRFSAAARTTWGSRR